MHGFATCIEGGWGRIDGDGWDATTCVFLGVSWKNQNVKMYEFRCFHDIHFLHGQYHNLEICCRILVNRILFVLVWMTNISGTADV